MEQQAFSRPFHGLESHRPHFPSTEVLGYFQTVRYADEEITSPAKSC
jgi:hypothetical protein